MFPSRLHFCSSVLILLCLLLISSCATIQRKAAFQWPGTVNFMEGSGDIDLSWKGRRFSGSFALKLESASALLFEVYGPFGQTLLHLKKEGELMDIVTAEGRKGSERLFEEQYGMSVNQFIEDLMMKGTIRETGEGNYIDRAGYSVLYTDRAGRPRICWLNPDGSICLTFTELAFEKDGQDGKDSRR